MAKVGDLVEFFTKGVNTNPERTIGIEVETHFIEPQFRMASYLPAQADVVKQAFFQLGEVPGWTFDQKSLSLVTHDDGSKILFELGRQNIELAMASSLPGLAVRRLKTHFDQLCRVMAINGLEPLYGPILDYPNGDLLAVPDSRDAAWIHLDGRSTLNLLARCASVQFTVSVSPNEVIPVLNRLNGVREQFLRNYPQDTNWIRYIQESNAPYLSDRYGGPVHFESIEDYCFQLSHHDVMNGDHLEKFGDVTSLDIPLFIRSIWWHFRMKRYEDTLCIECRPLPRLTDEEITTQMHTVLSIMQLD